MHCASCSCPECRGASRQAREFEAFETSSDLAPAGSRELLSENEEIELALELLSLQSEQELEQFLGKMFKRVGRGLASVGRFVGKTVVPVLAPALKTIAKTALPIAGGALGSLIPIPGVGTALGTALGHAAASALETEYAGTEPGLAELEKARRFVRLAARAIGNAAAALGTAAPEVTARQALVGAARSTIPVIDLSALQPSRQPAPSPARRSAPSGASARSTRVAPPGAPTRPGATGAWRRNRSTIVIDGV